MSRFRFRSLKELDSTEGTVRLVDAAHQFKDKRNTDIVLIPQPSDDINDPLNWPSWKKTLAFAPIVIFTALGTWVIGGLGTALVLLMIEFEQDLNSTATGLISWSVLAFGAGNFFWVPVALYFGKRPAFLASSFLFFGTIIWSAKATSFRSLVAARVLCAFAGSITEGLAAAISADIFFLHERGWWMGVYVVFLNGGSALGSLISAFIIEKGWRWHFWLTGILAGVNCILIVLFLPETAYYRNYVTGVQSVTSSDPEVGQGITTTDPETGKELGTTKTDDSPNGSSTSHSKKTFLQSLKPWSKVNPEANIIQLFLRPWPTILYPAVFFSFISFSTTLAWFICALNTNASIFQAPPYLMSPGINGLINVPALVGIAVGSYCGGGLTDWLAERSARKNNGVYEPEARLVALTLPFFFVPIGLLMYGLGVQHQTSWAVPFIGYGFICFGVTAIPAITMTYVIDAYFLVSYEALLLINGLKNIFSFGFSYGVIPWITLSGFKGAFGTMVGIQCGVMLFGVLLWYYGKQIRHTSANWKIISW